MANSVLEDAMESLTFDTQADAVKVPWDDTRITLQQQARTVRIPTEIEAHCARAVAKTQIGLFAQIHHAWVSVDDILYMWDYKHSGPRPLPIPSSGIIRTAGLVIPKPEIFDPAVTFLVVIATQETIHLVGLEYIEVTPLGQITNAPRSQIRVNLIDGFCVSTGGIPFDRVRASAAGRIFLSSSSSPHLYEVEYQKSHGLFRNKCRLVNLTAGIWASVKTATKLFAPRIIKLFEITSNYLFICDADNGLHLYLIQTADGRQTFARSCAISAREIELLIEQYFQLPRMSPYITHLFPCIGTSGVLHCMCLTQAGERLHFTVSCSRKTGPGVHGHGQPEILSGGEHFNFWLSHYSGLGQSASSAWRNGLGHGAPRPKVPRSESVDDRPPSLYRNGVWISGEGPLQLAVRTDRETDERATELVGALHVDGEVLAISEESEAVYKMINGHLRPSFPEVVEGDVGLFAPRRSFVLVTSTGVQFVHLIYQDRRAPQRRPPQTMRECARCLAMLQNDKSNDRPPMWMWCMEEGDQPSKWIQGLVFFLAVILRPFWKVPLVVRKGKVKGSEMLTWKPDEVADILGSLQCVVVFIRQCQRIAAPTTTEVPSAAHRHLQYTTTVNKKQAALLRANKLLCSVLGVVDRLIEVLVLLKLVHAHQNIAKILKAREWSIDANGKHAYQRLFELRLCDIVGRAAYASISTLCVAFVNDVRSNLGGDESTSLVELAKLAPTLYEAADRARRPTVNPLEAASNDFYSSYIRLVDVQSCNDAEVHSAARGVSKLVHTEPIKALDLCLEKVQQALNQPGQGEALLRAKALFEAFLGTTMQNGELNRPLLDLTLSKLETLHQGEPMTLVPFTYQCFFDFLLLHHRNQGAQLLVERYGPKVKELCEKYLEQRRDNDPQAAEALWKFYLKTHQYRQASLVLVQLSEETEGYGKSYTLPQRIAYLDLAKHAASKAVTLEPTATLHEAVATMKDRLEVARRAQKPLVLELGRLVQDQRVPTSIRQKANEELRRPELVLRAGGALDVIWRVADELGLPQILLCALDMFGSAQQTPRDTAATAWIRVLWPAPDSPYVRPELAEFPFILGHPQPFFGPHEAARSGRAQMSELPRRVASFVSDLANLSDGDSIIWDPFILAPILEYANVIFWSMEPKGNTRWVLELWQDLPFDLSTETLLGLYSQMVESCDTWVAELQATIGDDSQYKSATSDTVLVHLSEVLLDITNRWIEHVECNRQNPQVMTAYRSNVKDMEHIFATIVDKMEALPAEHRRVSGCRNRAMKLSDNLKKLHYS